MKNAHALLIGIGASAVIIIGAVVANTMNSQFQPTELSSSTNTSGIERNLERGLNSNEIEEDSLAEERAALEAERERLQQLADEQEKLAKEQELKRQQEEEARLAARQKLKDNTARAFVDYENVRLRLEARANNSTEMSELVSAFRSAVYELDEISVANIDPNVAEIVNDSRNNFSEFYDVLNTYDKQVTELENAPAADAVDSCIDAVTTQESNGFWESTFNCFGNGLVGGTVSSYRSSEAISQLDAETERRMQELGERQAKIEEYREDVTQYLKSEYGIELTYN